MTELEARATAAEAALTEARATLEARDETHAKELAFVTYVAEAADAKAKEAAGAAGKTAAALAEAKAAHADEKAAATEAASKAHTKARSAAVKAIAAAKADAASARQQAEAIRAEAAVVATQLQQEQVARAAVETKAAEAEAVLQQQLVTVIVEHSVAAAVESAVSAATAAHRPPPQEPKGPQPQAAASSATSSDAAASLSRSMPITTGGTRDSSEAAAHSGASGAQQARGPVWAEALSQRIASLTHEAAAALEEASSARADCRARDLMIAELLERVETPQPTAAPPGPPAASAEVALRQQQQPQQPPPQPPQASPLELGMEALLRQMEDCWLEVHATRDELSGDVVAAHREARDERRRLDSRLASLERAARAPAPAGEDVGGAAEATVGSAEAAELRAKVDAMRSELDGGVALLPALAQRLDDQHEAIATLGSAAAAAAAAVPPPPLPGPAPTADAATAELRSLQAGVAAVARRLEGMQAEAGERAQVATRTAEAARRCEAQCDAAEHEVRSGDVAGLRASVGALQRDVEAQVEMLKRLRAEAATVETQHFEVEEEQAAQLRTLEAQLHELTGAALPGLQRQLQAIADSSTAQWQVMLAQQEPPSPSRSPSRRQPLPAALQPQAERWVSPDKGRSSEVQALLSPLSSAVALAATLPSPMAPK